MHTKGNVFFRVGSWKWAHGCSIYCTILLTAYFTFPQLFSILFFSKKQTLNGSTHSDHTNVKILLLLYSGLCVVAISDEFCGCLVTVFIENEAQTVENVDSSTKIYIFSPSKSVMSSRLDI